jgi:hypothetical protein
MSIPVFFTINLLGAGPSKETPPDWEFAGRTLDSLVNALLAEGVPPTIFCSPESIRAHTPMLEEFMDRGCVLGVLVSPSQSALLDGQVPLGKLPLAQQAQVLHAAIEHYQQFLGQRPLVLRSGFSSATAETFALCKKHFITHTSMSMPGARLSQLGSLWDATDTAIHDISGLTEIPITTNPDERLFNRFPLYLSPEVGDAAVYTRLIERGKATGHLCVVANNHADYFQPESVVRANLFALLDLIHADASLRPCTIPPPRSNERGDT